MENFKEGYADCRIAIEHGTDAMYIRRVLRELKDAEYVNGARKALFDMGL